MTKVAVLTDIHGNAPALRAVMQEIGQRMDVDQIYCAGDMVSIGPDTNEVLDLICSTPNLSCVAGNHEQYVVALATGRDPGLKGGELVHQGWIADRLDRRFLPFLEGLPLSRTFQHGGHTLLLQHYHLDTTGRFSRIEKEPNGERLDALYSGSAADVVCFGHHHPVHLYRSSRRLYLNPGSLGCADSPVARYAILDLSNEQAEVELRSVPYDNSAFLASYQRLGVPERDFLLAVFHGNQHKNGGCP